MIELYDMHSHILPGVDDGSKNMNMTRKMLEIAYKNGIRHMVATPHFIVGRDNPSADKLRKLREDVQEEADKMFNGEMKIYLGNELFFGEGLVRKLDNKEALTINDTRYVLVEYSESETYEEIYRGAKHLINHGYSPIIAHVERYANVTKKIENVEELIKLGAYIQVNISSICGNIFDGLFDEQVKFSRKLLKYDMVHVFGTDAHRDESRSPEMKAGIDYINKHYGDGTTKILLNKNPKKLLADKII